MNEEARRTADTESTDQISSLLHDGPRVLNVGARTFADTLTAAGATHLHVDWQPPALGDTELGAMLAALADDDALGSLGARIREANEEALRRFFAADPVWEDVRPAREMGSANALAAFTKLRKHSLTYHTRVTLTSMDHG
jgi:hypothetical protein